MRNSKRVDSLFQTVDEINEYVKNQGLALFYGWAYAEKHFTVYWNKERGGEWQGFVSCAKASGARMLYLNWSPFEDFQIDDARRHLDSRPKR